MHEHDEFAFCRPELLKRRPYLVVCFVGLRDLCRVALADAGQQVPNMERVEGLFCSGVVASVSAQDVAGDTEAPHSCFELIARYAGATFPDDGQRLVEHVSGLGGGAACEVAKKVFAVGCDDGCRTVLGCSVIDGHQRKGPLHVSVLPHWLATPWRSGGRRRSITGRIAILKEIASRVSGVSFVQVSPD